jgi:hypothetical protein
MAVPRDARPGGSHSPLEQHLSALAGGLAAAELAGPDRLADTAWRALGELGGVTYARIDARRLLLEAVTATRPEAGSPAAQEDPARDRELAARHLQALGADLAAAELAGPECLAEAAWQILLELGDVSYSQAQLEWSLTRIVADAQFRAASSDGPAPGPVRAFLSSAGALPGPETNVKTVLSWAGPPRCVSGLSPCRRASRRRIRQVTR